MKRGCGFHLLLLLAAVMGCCTVAYRSAIHTHGANAGPDNMGLFWPILVPFAYAALWTAITLGRLVLAAVKRLRQPAAGR